MTTEELTINYHTEKGLKAIYQAERDTARRVLHELWLRVNTGYDFNADPDSVSLVIGAVLNGTERVHDVWPEGAAVWRCGPPRSGACSQSDKIRHDAESAAPKTQKGNK